MRTIRHAEEADILPLLSLSEAYFNEASSGEGWDWFDLDGDVLFLNLLSAIHSEDHAVIVADVEGKVVGGMWGGICPLVMTRATLARDLFLYVLPEYRDLWTANEIVSFFEEWAKGKGASAVSVGANSNIKGNRGAEVLYRRRGYSPLGFDFIKKIGD